MFHENRNGCTRSRRNNFAQGRAASFYQLKNTMKIIARMYFTIVWYVFFVPVSIARRALGTGISASSGWRSVPHRTGKTTLVIEFVTRIVLFPLSLLLFFSSYPIDSQEYRDEQDGEVSPFRYTML
jgi:hypothetical protein